MMTVTTKDDDELVLSSAAQAALAEFLAERQAQESNLHISPHNEPVSIDSFAEDWQVLPRRLPSADA
jgi:hypothetical protein